MKELVGSLDPVTDTEDRTLYAYRPRRRTARGILWLAIALGLLGAGVLAGRPEGRWYAWLFAVAPLLVGSAAAYCGMLDLLNRPLFHLEVDRRARTVALAMPKEEGQDLAKIRFADVARVEITEKGTPPSWNVTLLLRNGRRMGLGLYGTPEGAGRIATTFSDLVGAEIERPRNT